MLLIARLFRRVYSDWFGSSRGDDGDSVQSQQQRGSSGGRVESIEIATAMRLARARFGRYYVEDTGFAGAFNSSIEALSLVFVVAVGLGWVVADDAGVGPSIFATGCMSALGGKMSYSTCLSSKSLSDRYIKRHKSSTKKQHGRVELNRADQDEGAINIC